MSHVANIKAKILRSQWQWQLDLHIAVAHAHVDFDEAIHGIHDLEVTTP